MSEVNNLLMNSSNKPSLLFSIGHSTHTINKFINLLKQHDIKAIADIRSIPYSRRNPQFSREALERTLRIQGIAYIFLGKELGARRDEPDCYRNHKVDYGLVARTSVFREGLQKLVKNSLKKRVAMLCAERDPLTCHRTILVGRHLRKMVGDVQHILGNGDIETQNQAEERLLKEYKGQSSDLFATREQLIEEAYKQRADDIAYKEPIPLG